jgi:hypothetical protein
MILTIDKRDFEFKPYPLKFEERDIENTFARKGKTLRDTVTTGTSSTRKYKEQVFSEYGKHLDMPIGEFLLMLKNQGDGFYEAFLYKKYGDGLFCKFGINDNSIFNKKGLYIYCVNDKLMYIGKTIDSFYSRINAGYGTISPANCYPERQNTNCRLNHEINAIADEIVFKAHLMENDCEISDYEEKLKIKYKRLGECKWNLR